MKAYFTLAGLFDEVKINTGKTVKFDLQSIKVAGVEQLTAAYFSEVVPTFVDPHSSNLWEFASCVQTGAYPNPTTISACTIGGFPNSFNPFKDSLKCNYSNVVGGAARGEITGSVSTSVYGLEQFLFGFDMIDVPVNDIVGGGSSGATKEGAWYLDIDTAQDFEMTINVQVKDSLGILISNKNHVYSHETVNCEFAYEVTNLEYKVSSEAYFGNSNIDASNLQFVDGGFGFAYSAAGRSGYILKLDLATNTVTSFGSYPYGVAPQYYWGVYSPTTNKIYFLPDVGGASDVLVIDPATDNVTSFAWTPLAYPEKPCITPNGIIYANTNSTNAFYKIDTNTETITELTSGATNGGGASIYSTNGFVYFIPSAGATEFYKLNTATDAISTIAAASLTFSIHNAIETSTGLIYATGTGSDIFKVDTSTDSSSSFTGIADLRGLVLMPDNNIFGIDYLNSKVYKIQIDGDVVSEAFNIGTYGTYVAVMQIGLNAYYIGVNLNEPILKLTFSGNTITDSTQVSFLSGGLNGWIDPACGGSGNVNDDPIVTQSICLLPRARRTPVTVFDTNLLKRCCYFSPVFASSTDTDNFKNDFNSFLFERTYTSDTIDFVLLKNGGFANGGTDIPLIDNTYGTLYNYGFLGTTNKKGYKIEWRNVLLLQGEGTYQLQTTITGVQGVIEEYSLVFKLKEYADSAVKGTVRIDSLMNGYLRNIDFDYKGLQWQDSIRVRGFFGNRQAEYEQEQIIYTNRQSKQLRSEMINTYTLQTMHIPSCITDLIIEYHNFANYLYITDYNPINHKKDYIRKQVVFETMDDIDYKSVTDLAPLVMKYKDYVQNYTKSNC